MTIALTFDDGLCRAEAILRDLALVLRRLPVDDHTRGLHLRALRLKRDVERWRTETPDEAVRRTVFDEIHRLQLEASIWEVRTPSDALTDRRIRPSAP